MRPFLMGLFVGFICFYFINAGLFYAAQGSEFVLSRHEVAQQEGRRVARTTICNDCMGDIGTVLYDISYVTRNMAVVQEHLLDTVYGYAKKKKTGFLASASRAELQELHQQLITLHDNMNNLVVLTKKIVTFF